MTHNPESQPELEKKGAGGAKQIRNLKDGSS